MALTVFYSWQSDLSSRSNRSFIERALEKAIGKVAESLEVVEAEREELILDKDTKGIPGIPPIADVIFEKISKAAVFVPDLTFVGKSLNGRPIPNPNVLIEYGWALKVLGHSRIVPIMNAAYGEPTAGTLPFDMKHLRHPITYCVTDDVEQADRVSTRDSLAIELAGAIRLVLESVVLVNESHDKDVFKETPSTTTPSTFLKPDEPLGVVEDPERQLRIPDNAHIFLRLMSTQPTEPISSSKAALGLIHSGRLQPMYDGSGSFTSGRNSYGAFTCFPDKEQVLHVTQLFKNRELWGIDTRCIGKQSRMNPYVDCGYFPCVAFEDTFKRTLANYLEFAEKVLHLPLPLRFIAGATNVEGYRMANPTGFGSFENFEGRVVDPHILYDGAVESYQTEPIQILRPFFNRVWEECGLTRPDKDTL